MNFLIIVLVGVGLVMVDDNPKDLPTIIEEQLICKPFDSNLCAGWAKDYGIIGESVWKKYLI